MGVQRLALLPTPKQLVSAPVRRAWQSAPCWQPGASSPSLGSRCSLASLCGSLRRECIFSRGFLTRRMRKQENAGACGRRCNYDGRETEAGGQQEPTPPGAAGPQPRRPRNTRRIGSGLLARGLFRGRAGCCAASQMRRPIQVLGGALTIRWRKPRAGVTLRRHLRDHQPCPSNIPGRRLRFACAPRSPVATSARIDPDRGSQVRHGLAAGRRRFGPAIPHLR